MPAFFKGEGLSLMSNSVAVLKLDCWLLKLEWWTPAFKCWIAWSHSPDHFYPSKASLKVAIGMFLFLIVQTETEDSSQLRTNVQYEQWQYLTCPFASAALCVACLTKKKKGWTLCTVSNVFVSLCFFFLYLFLNVKMWQVGIKVSWKAWAGKKNASPNQKLPRECCYAACSLASDFLPVYEQALLIRRS